MRRLRITRSISVTISAITFCVLAIASAVHFYPTQNSPTHDRADSAWITYTDTQYGFSFQYPANLQPVIDVPEIFNNYVDPNRRVYFTFPISDTKASTTGILSAISLGVSSEGTSTCSELGGKYTHYLDTPPKRGRAIINGLTYDTLVIGTCGAAYCLDFYQNSMVKNNLCFRADLVIDTQLPFDPTTPDDIAAIDYKEAEANLQSVFQHMLTTFAFSH